MIMAIVAFHVTHACGLAHPEGHVFIFVVYMAFLKSQRSWHAYIFCALGSHGFLDNTADESYEAGRQQALQRFLAGARHCEALR